MSDDINETRHNHLKESFEKSESRQADRFEKLDRRIERMEMYRKIEALMLVLVGIWLASNPSVAAILKGL